MPLLQPPSSELRPYELSYTHAYQSIVSRVRRSGGSSSGGVVVFSGSDIDGLLAARILASLFKQDDIPYRLVPVGSYPELETKRDEAFASEELHTLILLSLGSLLPLAQYFKLPKGCHLHIIDAHRPWNLSNLFGIELDVADEEDDNGANGSAADSGRIWVWGDGDEQSLGEVKKSWEALEYEPSDSGSESGDDDDGEEEETDEEEEEEEEEEEAEEGEPDEEEESGEEDNEPGPSRKRARAARPDSGPGPKLKKAKQGKSRRREVDADEEDDRPRRLPRAIRDAHYDRIQRYYESGTGYGMSVSQSVYLLATELERADNDLLWWAILGATHQYISNRIDRERYEMYHELFLDEVVRLNHAPALGGGKVPNPDDRSISNSDELRFMLFRHWTLYDAMLHSGYVAGRLGIWRERGRKKLQGLLAKMGFSLQQCTQAYPHMDTNLKRALPDKLSAIAPEYGLVELTYPSFQRSFGFQLAGLSAADAVEGISSLLEVASGHRMEVEKEGGRNGGEWFGGTRIWNVGRESEGSARNGGGRGDKENIDPRGEAPKDTQEKEAKKEQVWQVANFWTAYDACEDVSLLRRSLSLAKSLHSAIIRQGSSLLDKSSIRPLRTFRFCAIKEGPDLKLFNHPATLSRLALWLMDATRDKWAEKVSKSNDKRRKDLPFVVAALDEVKGGWLVVGITGGMEYGDVRKNKFGLAFQQAAEESGSNAKHDMFDTSVVEVPKDDLTSFVECLHLRSI